MRLILQATCSCVKSVSHRPGLSVGLPHQPLGWRPAYVPRDTRASSVNSVLWDTKEKYLMGVPIPTASPAPATSMAPVTPTQVKSPESHSKAPWTMWTQWDEDWSSQMALGGYRHCFVLALFPGVSPLATKSLIGT